VTRNGQLSRPTQWEEPRAVEFADAIRGQNTHNARTHVLSTQFAFPVPRGYVILSRAKQHGLSASARNNKWPPRLFEQKAVASNDRGPYRRLMAKCSCLHRSPRARAHAHSFVLWPIHPFLRPQIHSSGNPSLHTQVDSCSRLIIGLNRTQK
jgi:hypothetical protein